MTILDKIAERTLARVAERKLVHPTDELAEKCAGLGRGEPKFRDALCKEGLSFICEVKRASPSCGMISPDFPYLEIARDYEAGGADAVSCLTEPEWFLGSDEIFADVRREIGIPMLRKDFTVDEYQLYEARLLGADAVLLISSLLNTKTLSRYLEICDSLGLDALVEAHTEDEIASAVDAGARIIGVNNRNLKDFTVDFSNASRLRSLIPNDAVYVAESGVKSPDDVHALSEIGADAALIGEYLMKSADRKKTLAELYRAAGRKIATDDEN
ncbi:MAG: indole-3-glycerol phosphate synthase TrpC [Firmicutes bacterium]|nr:indole-3-glycerol phosphate synthase TrpC [Bacillota bacterium]